MIRRPRRSPLFPYTALFRSRNAAHSPVISSDDAAVTVRVVPTDEDRMVARHTRRLIEQDRKSTRLNFSHANISYAVFCLKKKTTEIRGTEDARNVIVPYARS